MDIYQPPQTGKYPALIIIYGGAWQSGTPANNREFSQYMAARGYTVFAIAYRHAPKYPFPAQLNDVRTAIDFIRKNAGTYEADSDRMVLMGRSAGGHLVMLAAYQSDAPPIKGLPKYNFPNCVVRSRSVSEGQTSCSLLVNSEQDARTTIIELEIFLFGSP
jgi:acetyl esterase/lipase